MGNMGQVNVSVNANTAQAVRNMREFAVEAKATANAVRTARSSMTFNTGDFSRLSEGADQMRQMQVRAQELGGMMIDLRENTSRYSQVAKDNAGFLKQGAAQLATFSRGAGQVAAALAAAKAGFEFGQAIQRHAEYIHSASDAWREFKSVIGMGKGGLDLEMENLAKQQAKAEANIARLNKQIDDNAAKKKRAAEMAVEGRGVLASVTRERRVMLEGKENVEWGENSAKYGMSIATRIAEVQDHIKTIEEQREKAAKMADLRNEAAMKKEREHQSALKREADRRKQEAEAMQELRQRVADFNKSDLDKERDMMLRTVTDKRQHKEIRDRFAQIGELEQGKKNREALYSRPANSMLDARTTEGWIQLRASVQSKNEKVAIDQLAVLKEIRDAAKDKPKLEVFKF